MNEINQALQAYQNAQKQQSGIAAPETEGPSFGELIKTSLEGAIEAQKTSEAVTAQAMSGNASMIEVVSALNQAEMSLHMVTAVRDRVISAYQDIIRMPI